MQNRHIETDAQNVSLVIRLYDAFNGAPKTGLTISNLQIRYIRNEIDNDVTISSWQSLTALANLTAAHTDNYGYEVGNGFYRVDIPDAVVAAGINEAIVLVQDSVSNSILIESYQIHVSIKTQTDKIIDGVITQGTIASEVSSISFGLMSSAREADNAYVGNSITVTDVTDGHKETRKIIAYLSNDRMVTVDKAFTFTPDADDTYIIHIGMYGDTGVATEVNATANKVTIVAAIPSITALATENNVSAVGAAVAGLNDIAATDVITALKAATGFTQGGTWTFAKMMKVMAALFAGGNWALKDGETDVYEITDPDDGETVVAEATVSASGTILSMDIKI